MKDELVKLIGDKLNDLDVVISDVYSEKEGKQTFLRVEIDNNSDEIMDIDKVVEVTKIIDPIIEKADFIKDEYILDVYAKSKGDD